MDKELTLILSYLKNYIHKKADTQNKDMGLSSVLNNILSQGLDCVLLDSLDSVIIGKDHNKKIFLQNMLYINEFNKLIEIFKTHNIEIIVIKGYAISRFYNNPLCRRMCDFDILIKSTEINKASKILVENGYIQVHEEDNHPMHLAFQKRQSVPVEIHSGLINTLYLGTRSTEEWYEQIWMKKQLVNIYNIQFFAMSNEDELINQIIHFANHLVYHGATLKNLFELALIIGSSRALNWEYIYNILEKLEYLGFGKLLLSLCVTFFSVEIPEYLSNEKPIVQKNFINDLYFYFSKRLNEGTIEGWLRIISKYRFILRKPYLQPLIWCISLYCQYKANKLKFILRNTINDIKNINKRLYILQRYKLLTRFT